MKNIGTVSKTTPECQSFSSYLFWKTKSRTNEKILKEMKLSRIYIKRIILGFLGLSRGISGNLSLELDFSGYIGLFLDISDYFGLFLAISGFLWLSPPIYLLISHWHLVKWLTILPFHQLYFNSGLNTLGFVIFVWPIGYQSEKLS